jgi:hypothetical protein
MSHSTRIYALNHEGLPYTLERSLPFNVIDNIYSFLRPDYAQKHEYVQIERYEVEINHNISEYSELLQALKRNNEKRKKHQEEFATKLNEISLKLNSIFK